MAKEFADDHFWSAVKRKSIAEMLTIMFAAGNCPLAAEASGSTTRMTDAAITRMRDALAKDLGEEVAVEPEPETTTEDVKVEDEDESRLSVAEIKDLVATGKKKKIKIAHKAFKDQFKKDHPQYKELKKLFKKDK